MLRRRRFSLAFAAVLALVASTQAADFGVDPLLTLDLGGGVKMELLRIQRGTFTEGSPPEEQGRADTETARKVTLTHDFYLGKYPVTVGQFKRFVAETGHLTEAETGTSGGYGFDGTALVQRKEFTWKNPGFPQTDEHPVTIVTYGDADAFAKWLARKTEYQLMLPTEAQWEFACRAGSSGRFSFGDADSELADHAWYKANAGKGTHPVGRKKPNAFGLYDMSGNVFEWCRDWSVARTAAAATDPEARAPDAGSKPRRVLRGGSWMRDPKHARSAARYQADPGTRNAENGFRLSVNTGANGVALHTGAGNVGGGAGATPQQDRTTAPPAAPFAKHEPAESPPGLRGSTKVVIGVAAVLLIGVMIFLAKFLGSSGEQEWKPQQLQQPQNSNFATGAALGAAGLGAANFGNGGDSRYFTQADDGFWFDRLDISPGTLLQIAYLLNGMRQQQRVTTERGTRQFVYTGGRPENIQIVSADTPNDAYDDFNDPNRYPVDTSPPIRHSQPDISFRGHPSAY